MTPLVEMPRSNHESRLRTPPTLPAAVGGQPPIRHAVPNVPPGLTFDPATRTLAGTPTEASAARSHVYRTTDAAGAIATLRIAIANGDHPSFGRASVPALESGERVGSDASHR